MNLLLSKLSDLETKGRNAEAIIRVPIDVMVAYHELLTIRVVAPLPIEDGVVRKDFADTLGALVLLQGLVQKGEIDPPDDITGIEWVGNELLVSCLAPAPIGAQWWELSSYTHRPDDSALVVVQKYGEDPAYTGVASYIPDDLYNKGYFWLDLLELAVDVAGEPEAEPRFDEGERDWSWCDTPNVDGRN